MIMDMLCHNSDRMVQGDNFFVECISYRKKAYIHMVKILLFHLNYGSTPRQSMFVNKLDT